MLMYGRNQQNIPIKNFRKRNLFLRRTLVQEWNAELKTLISESPYSEQEASLYPTLAPTQDIENQAGI